MLPILVGLFIFFYSNRAATMAVRERLIAD